MLKGISKIVSPELLKVLSEMGHGDDIVFADANFPAANYAKRLIRSDGLRVCTLLNAILPLFPLDTFVPKPVGIMNLVDPSKESTPLIWTEYKKVIEQFYPDFGEFEKIERLEFYKRASSAYCIVATGEGALYANIILKKGVIF